MARLTGGDGWSLSSDEPQKPVKKENPKSPVPKIRLEYRAGGKSVTVISGLHTYGLNRLNTIARELKSSCGAGGTVKNGAIEIQGDQIQNVKAWFSKRTGLLTVCLWMVLALFGPAAGWAKSTDSTEPFSRRALFVSVIQEPGTLGSREAMLELIRFSKKARIDTLFIQIYRANKAWFPSKTADDNPYREAYKKVDADPLRFLIKEAHAAGIEVHAWLNLLSLSQNAEALILKKYGPEILTQKPGAKTTLEDYKIDNQYFLEPGDTRVRGELDRLMTEILGAYPELDGVQLDYIRYPDSHPFYGYTPQNIERFKKTTRETSVEESNPVWKEWRRNQVTELVELLAKRARSIRPEIQVSTTGCAPYARAYHEAFQDWASWLDRGLVDFVTMMSYPADLPTFERYISIARGTAVDFGKVMIGVGAYKLVKEPVIFSAQYQACEKASGLGCAVFHYGSVLENPELADFLTSRA